MSNEIAKGEMAALLDDVRKQMRTIAEVQRDRARLIGSATVRANRVTVRVNADGTVIETEFGPDIADLGYAEIAKAVTEAAQAAAADVARKGRDLMMPLHDQRARLPKLSDLIDGMPELSEMTPEPPTVSLAPPGSPARRLEEVDADAMTFDDVESYDHDGSTRRGVTDSLW